MSNTYSGINMKGNENSNSNRNLKRRVRRRREAKHLAREIRFGDDWRAT